MPNGVLVYKRGEIWWVDLRPIVGSETDKVRPCLVLQNDLGNLNGETTMIAPLLPGAKRYPFTVNVIATYENKLDKQRYINFSQMKVVDSQRFIRKLGELEDIYWEEIKKAVLIELGF